MLDGKAIAANLLVVACGSASAAGPGSEVFAQYQALQRSFDPAVADLYCTEALIRSTRRYPDGTARTLEFPADTYKSMIRSAMPLARSRGDFNDYSRTTVVPAGENERVTTSRYSHLKKYASPLTLVVGRCRSGAMGILQEISESQP